MKGVKCFGLLLVFFTIFGLSLNVSLDVNALKYPISSINIGSNTINFGKLKFSDGDHFVSFLKNNNLTIGFSSQPSGFRFPHTWRFSGNYLSDSNTCELDDYSDGVFSYNNTRFYVNSLVRSYDFYSLNSDDSPFNLKDHPLTFGNNQWLLNNSPDRLCSISDYNYTSHTDNPSTADQNFPRWNWSSLINIPLVNERFAYENSKPYFYNFNKLYLIGTDKVDGVLQRRNGLKMSQIFGSNVSSLSTLSFSFDLFSDPVNRLDYEDSPENSISTFTLIGSIYFDSDFTWNSPCDSNPTCLSLGVNNYNINSYTSISDHSFSSITSLPDGSNLYEFFENNNRYYSNNNCTITKFHVSQGSDSNHVDFSCSYTPNSSYLSSNIDFRLLSLSLLFGEPLGSSTDFLQTDGDYTFKDFYIITNNDDTYIEWDATSGSSGGDIQSAPGFGLGGGGSIGTDPDFLTSLKQMFTFTFINPFAPIFNLFGDNNSCASIPVISSMLHSDESQVCPWFDHTTRNIVTPVLGLSSMMLVFGFAVRWLGSSSGNLFEDSHQTENYSFSNKFRRKK